MTKIPVIEIIKLSYGFLFQEFGTVFRLAWFPMLVFALVNVGLQFAATPSTISDATALSGWGIASTIVNLVSYAIVAVAIHRVILFNDRKPGTVLLISFGAAERLFIGFGILVWIAVTVGSVGAAGTMIATGTDGLPIVFLAFLVVAAYITIRLLLLYPIIVVERRLDFRLAFAMSKGNFWQLFGVVFLGMLPIVLGIVVLELVAGLLASMSGAEASPDLNPINYIVRVASDVFVSIVTIGVSVPLACYAYKAVRNIGPFEYLDENASTPPVIASDRR